MPQSSIFYGLYRQPLGHNSASLLTGAILRVGMETKKPRICIRGIRRR